MCWPDAHPPTVHQELDGENNGLERLVIYLYKNVATNEIKMYTPNANKQMLIPDIPYEANDGLVTITTENVYSVLLNNPCKIKVYNDHIEKIVPAVADSLAIGLDVGAIENIYPNGDSYLIPNNTYEGNEYNYVKADGPTGEVVYELQKGSTNEPYNYYPGQNDHSTSYLTPGQDLVANNYPYTNQDQYSYPLNPQTPADNTLTIIEEPVAIPGNSPYSPHKLTVKPLLSGSLVPNSQGIIEEQLTIPGNSPNPPNRLTVTPIHSGSLLPNSQGIIEDPLTIPGNSPYSPHKLTIKSLPSGSLVPNSQVIIEEQLTIPGNSPLPPNGLTVTPIHSGSLLPNPQIIIEETLTIPGDSPYSPHKLTVKPLLSGFLVPNSQGIIEEQLTIPGYSPYPPRRLTVKPLQSGSLLPNPQGIIEEQLVIPGGSPYPPNWLTITPIQSDSLQPNSQGMPENSQDYLINPQTIPGSPHVFPDSYSGGVDKIVVYTFQTEQGRNKFESGSQQMNNPISVQQVMTFNIWFNQQMQRFQNARLPNYIKTIDSDTLKLLVQKTFYENDIYISTDGVITDAEGIVIDVSNLELRPLLLGEKFNHQFLKSSKIIKLPKHLPYLEGILVTLVSPPQILGIIPLGKTYLPETTYLTPSLAGLTTTNGSKIFINGVKNINVLRHSNSAKGTYNLGYKDIYPPKYYVPVAGNLESYNKVSPVINTFFVGNKNPQRSEYTFWSSGPYQTGSNVPYPTANWNPSELIGPVGQRRVLSAKTIQHLYEKPTKKKGTGRRQHTDLIKDVSEEDKIPESFFNLNATKSGRRFPAASLSGVMKTLLYLLDDLPSRRGFNSTGRDAIVNDSESDDGGSPDFRIIGGNAATGSGTPVSNKGRSGLEYA